MFTTIKGYFDNGQIYLQEEFPVTSKTDVMVTFLTGLKEQQAMPGKRMAGSLKGRVNTPDDFNAPLDDLKDYM